MVDGRAAVLTDDHMQGGIAGAKHEVACGEGWEGKGEAFWKERKEGRKGKCNSDIYTLE